MKKRTFGWVQNPNKLQNLKKTVSIFTDTSFKVDLLNRRLPILLKNNCITIEDYNAFIHTLKNQKEIPYELLKGKGAGGKSRSQAKCSGIIQACIDGQANAQYKDLNDNNIICKKMYTDDWSADGFVRWALATGLLEYNNNNDTCKITELGKELVNTKQDSYEEKNAFTKALLKYPPVIRVLSLLENNGEMTKFEIGEKLGFKGEPGFSSIPQNEFTYEYFLAPKSTRKEVRSNVEGDSDKYARTICGWLQQMNWVKRDKKIIEDYHFNETVDIQSYSITLEGKKALKISRGYSSNPRIAKIVNIEMLASNKAPNAQYLRKKRALIIEAIANFKTIDKIIEHLNRNGLSESATSIKDDLKNLENIGLEISVVNGKYKIADKIEQLTIPSETIAIDELTKIHNRVRDKLQYLNHDYLGLIDMAYGNSGSSQTANAKEFEIETSKLFTKELGFEGMHLGGANKPDIIISDENKGAIIDNKAYSDGFTLDRHCSDEMSRYILENKNRMPNVPINEWWKNFKPNVDEFYYLFITSFLRGTYQTNLEQLSANTDSIGAAIGMENLLYVADAIKGNVITRQNFFEMINNDGILYQPA